MKRMPRKFRITLAKGSFQTFVWKRNGEFEEGGEEIIEIAEEIKWVTLKVTIPDGDNIDIETLRANKNGEWMEYDWEIEDIDNYGYYQVNGEMLNDDELSDFEENLHEEGYKQGETKYDWNSDVLSMIEEIS